MLRAKSMVKVKAKSKSLPCWAQSQAQFGFPLLIVLGNIGARSLWTHEQTEMGERKRAQDQHQSMRTKAVGSNVEGMTSERATMRTRTQTQGQLQHTRTYAMS